MSRAVGPPIASSASNHEGHRFPADRSGSGRRRTDAVELATALALGRLVAGLNVEPGKVLEQGAVIDRPPWLSSAASSFFELDALVGWNPRSRRDKHRA